MFLISSLSRQRRRATIGAVGLLVVLVTASATVTATTATAPAAAAAGPSTTTAAHSAGRHRATNNNAAWVPVADEDFNGSLTDRWVPFSGVPGCCSDTVWSPTQVSVSHGRLTLRNDPTAGTWLSGGVGAWDWSAATRQYGRWDARIRMDAGEGVSATALLYPRTGWPPEINYFEIFETWGERDQVQVTTHFKQGGSPAQSQEAVSGNFRRWHVFSIRWTADRLVFKIDGSTVQVETDPARIPDQPMWPGFQTHVHRDSSGAWPTLADGQRSVRMQVDWMRVYAPAA